jgi:ubiquitin-conjugating enzyme E2 variant
MRDRSCWLDNCFEQTTIDVRVSVFIEDKALPLKDRGGTFPCFELMSVVAFFAAQALGATRLVSSGSDGLSSTGLVVALACLSAWLLADLASGVVHYVADNFGSPTTPILGSRLIAPFREHHHEPESILRHGFLERNANNAFLALFVCSWVPFSEIEDSWDKGLATFSFLLGWWIFLTNQIHAWAHTATPPRAVRWLQNCRVLLSPEQHERHHRAARQSTAGSHYCITSGVSDRLLEHIRSPRG